MAISGQSSFRSACGAAVFRLDDAAVRAIAERGMTFFQPAWRATPMPDGRFSNGWWYGFECAQGISMPLKRAIYDAVRRPGGFYSHDISSNQDLIVLPDMQLAVFIYEDS